MDYFKLVERESNLIAEIKGAVSSFASTVYLVFINAYLLSNAGLPFTDALRATCLVTSACTFICGLISNFPCVIAPGIGLCGFFAFGLVSETRTWERALSICFVAGLLLLFLCLVRIVDYVYRLMPTALKYSTFVSFGLMLVFISMRTLNLSLATPNSIVQLHSLTVDHWLVVGNLFIVGLFLYYQLRGAVLLGIFFTAMASWLIHSSLPITYSYLQPVFEKTLNVIDLHSLTVSDLPYIICIAFVVLFEVYAATCTIGRYANVLLIDEDLPYVYGQESLIWISSLGTICSALLGSGPVHVYVDSIIGVRDGARTGISSIICALLYVVAFFVTPLFSALPDAALSSTVLFVGFSCLTNMRYIDWSSTCDVFCCSTFVAILSFTFSLPLAMGVALGFYFLMWVLSGQFIRFILNRRSVGTSFYDRIEVAFSPSNGLGDEDDLNSLKSSHSFWDELFAPSFVYRSPSLLLPSDELKAFRTHEESQLPSTTAGLTHSNSQGIAGGGLYHSVELP
eukprot:TRINITY_DN2287_c0_g1_i1.p1 TRINITY_DN2287_c0_g1~~TRINITY_DN2287_c0_g1_i1.p1  ORF type:complete len:511 (-),score=57.11 TRINITY_DN2287_c0_g1_i1:54-1586(-)